MQLVSDGLNLAKQNKFQEAEPAFKEASQRDPNNDQAYGNLGSVYIALGKHSEALDPTQKAINLNPKNPIWHLNLAELYSMKGEKEKALSEIELAINNDFHDKNKIKSFNFKTIEKDPKFKELMQKI